MFRVKGKKSLFAVIAILVLSIGVTIAYYSDSVNIDNVFQVGGFSASVVEVFESPANWTPGDETSKEFTVENTGTVPVMVRVRVDEEWRDANNNLLPLVEDGELVSIVNYVNTNDWKKDGEYFYYKTILDAGDITSTFIESVTFNDNVEVASTICKNINAVRTCDVIAGYRGKYYKLTLTAELVQSDMIEDAWDVTSSYISGNASRFLLRFDPVGGTTNVFRTAVVNADTYADLPTPIKDGYIFSGWYLDSNYTTKIEDGDTISLSEDKVVYAKWTLPPPVCKAASSLHTADNKTYGVLSNGTFRSGTAFDCDLNDDGVFNSTTERFYYVSDYYDTSNDSFNSNVATLVYYSNVSLGVPDSGTVMAYNSNGRNYEGPSSARIQLPAKTLWSLTLLNDTRQIVTDTGSTSTGGGSLPESFDYSSYAARFLTTQELVEGCPILLNGSSGQLSSCNYLLENTLYSNSSYPYGYWLETPLDSGNTNVWAVNGSDSSVSIVASNSGTNYGVRPVIDVAKTRIQLGIE